MKEFQKRLHVMSCSKTMLKECDKIVSYLFYNQTDTNGACKNRVKLRNFIYGV